MRGIGILRGFWNDLKTDRGLTVEPRYVELAFGCPPIEWDIDARVRDFAERMGDEYTSLYEQDTTGIKGGDFERFGAFADNHLDFIRALTKARGMDPISSDREIAAFLNTFDKLAAMPEPTPAKQEKRRAFRRRMRSGRPVEPRTVIVIRHDPVNVRNDTDKGHGIIGRQR